LGKNDSNVGRAPNNGKNIHGNCRLRLDFVCHDILANRTSLSINTVL